MSIGDIHSNEPGSGARYNTGKVALELIPLRLIAAQFEQQPTQLDGQARQALAALHYLAAFQEGAGRAALHAAIESIGAAWDECAAVFEYGRQKYAAWNWAKGMPWSTPIACAARHIVYGILEGEQADKESKLSHRGHILCNIVMLLTYMRTYPAGDDRPAQWLSAAQNTKES